MRHHVAGRVHGFDQEFAIFDPDVHVGPENEEPLGQFLEVFLDPEVTIEWGDFLLHPARERVTARRDHFESVLSGQIHDQSSQPDQFGPGLGRGPADLGADLDHGLMELRFDLAEDHRILFQDLGDVRAEFPGRRVDDLILFFDPDR